MNISAAILKSVRNLVIPIVSLILCLVLYFVFISSYQTYSASFEAMKTNYESSIVVLNNNLKILEETNQNKDKISKLEAALKSLVSDSANPSDIVGMIDKYSNEFRFRAIDENRSITNQENDKNKLIEVRFNGRSPGMASSINFLKSLSEDKTKLVKITRLELTNIPEELFTRVSFNAFSVYSSPPPKFTIESSLQNVYGDSEFLELLNSF